MDKENRISLVNLGCFKNNVDTEVLAGLLQNEGFTIVSTYENAHWLIINTCGFIQNAKEEGISEILEGLEQKEKGKIKYLVVFGCLVQRYYREFRDNFKKVDLFWGVNDIPRLARMIGKKDFSAEYKDRGLFLYDHRHHRPAMMTGNSSFIKISEGCNMGCSFCAIPSIRGPYRSRTVESLVREAGKMADRGVQELNVISQNSSYFGRDRPRGPCLDSLLEELSRLDIPWIRVLYLMPEEMSAPLIEAFGHDRILPYFDLPFQHVAPGILDSMNRRGDIKEKYRLIENIRGRFDHAVIRSAFIVGYPGESRQDFSELVAFARETRIERIGVFGYSDEDGTPAFGLSDKISPEEIQERKEKLMDVSDDNMADYNRSLIGGKMDFIPQGPSPWKAENHLGRVSSQAPQVDGFTELIGEKEPGSAIIPVRIVDFKNEILYARPEPSGLKEVPGKEDIPGK